MCLRPAAPAMLQAARAYAARYTKYKKDINLLKNNKSYNTIVFLHGAVKTLLVMYDKNKTENI